MFWINSTSRCWYFIYKFFWLQKWRYIFIRSSNGKYSIYTFTTFLASCRRKWILQNFEKFIKFDDNRQIEVQSPSINYDVSHQEIPPTTPKSDLTCSSTSEIAVKFTYGETIEKASTDTMDITTRSIYVRSETDDFDSEKSSESHQSTVQKLEWKISSTVDKSQITTTVEEN